MLDFFINFFAMAIFINLFAMSIFMSVVFAILILPAYFFGPIGAVASIVVLISGAFAIEASL